MIREVMSKQHNSVSQSSGVSTANSSDSLNTFELSSTKSTWKKCRSSVRYLTFKKKRKINKEQINKSFQTSKSADVLSSLQRRQSWHCSEYELRQRDEEIISLKESLYLLELNSKKQIQNLRNEITKLKEKNLSLMTEAENKKAKKVRLVLSVLSSTQENILSDIGFSSWQHVPAFAETKVRFLLQFIFPNNKFDETSDILSHFIVAGSVLSRPHFGHVHYRKQFGLDSLVQCQLGNKYQFAIEFGLKFDDYNSILFGNHNTYVVTGGFVDSAFNFSQKIFECWGIDMSKWQEVWDEDDINHEANPQMIILHMDHIDRDLNLAKIDERIHQRSPRTRLIIESYSGFSTLEFDDLKSIKLRREFALETRIRLHLALESIKSSNDYSFPIVHRRTQERKILFMVKFVTVLDSWLESQGLPLMEYCEVFHDMPTDLTGEWFSEKWNLWLKSTIEHNSQKLNSERAIDFKFLKNRYTNLKSWAVQNAPWKCDGLEEIPSIDEYVQQDKITTLLEMLKNSQLMNESSTTQYDDMPIPAPLCF